VLNARKKADIRLRSESSGDLLMRSSYSKVSSEISDESADNSAGLSLLKVLQAFLALEGKAFSIGALRDLGDPGNLRFTKMCCGGTWATGV